MSKPAALLAPLAAAAVFAFAPGAASAVDARAIALDYVRANAASLGVLERDVAGLAVTSSYTSAHSGVTHVNLNQRHDGLEAFGAHVTVNVASDGRVLFAAGSLELADPDGLRVLSLSVAGAQEAVVSDGGISAEPIPARLGWQPTKAGLRLAWQVTIDDISQAHLWNATVASRSGELPGARPHAAGRPAAPRVLPLRLRVAPGARYGRGGRTPAPLRFTGSIEH